MSIPRLLAQQARMRHDKAVLGEMRVMTEQIRWMNQTMDHWNKCLAKVEDTADFFVGWKICSGVVVMTSAFWYGTYSFFHRN